MGCVTNLNQITLVGVQWLIFLLIIKDLVRFTFLHVEHSQQQVRESASLLMEELGTKIGKENLKLLLEKVRKSSADISSENTTSQSNIDPNDIFIAQPKLRRDPSAEDFESLSEHFKTFVIISNYNL